MSLFIALATLMTVAVAAVLATPLLRRPRRVAVAPDRRAANLAILRDQLAELESERTEGSLTAADFDQARSELQRRLLDELQPENLSEKEALPSKKTALIVCLLLPLVALGGYALLGAPRALDPANVQPPPRMTADQIEDMVARLAARLKQNPDDAKGWVMLARSYRMLGRYAESAEAYAQAMPVVEQDPTLLADYAEMLAMTTNGFKGKPTELINKALKLAPEDPQVLLLAGAAAGERKDFKAAVGYWEKVLPQLEPGSEEANALGAALAQARSMSRQSGAPVAASSRVSGQIALAPGLANQIKADELLFVFARADGDKGMPLAVIRTRTAQFPMTFVLDDLMALPGGEKLSSAKSLTIEARVARSGEARTASGDLFGRKSGIKPGASGVKLVIDQVVP